MPSWLPSCEPRDPIRPPPGSPSVLPDVACLDAPVETLGIPDALVLTQYHTPGLRLTLVDFRQFLAQILRLHRGLGGRGALTSPGPGQVSELAVPVVFMMVAVLPELHKEQRDGSCNVSHTKF